MGGKSSQAVLRSAEVRRSREEVQDRPELDQRGRGRSHRAHAVLRCGEGAQERRDYARGSDRRAGAIGRWLAVRRGQHGVAPPDRELRSGLCGVRTGRGLRRQGRRGHHRRSLHRPSDAGPAMVRRATSGGRGQGGCARQGRVTDASHYHAPKFLQTVRQDCGHDRNGHDRGRRVHEDLQARRGGGAYEPPGQPHGLQRSHLQDGGRQVRRDCRGDP